MQVPGSRTPCGSEVASPRPIPGTSFAASGSGTYVSSSVKFRLRAAEPACEPRHDGLDRNVTIERRVTHRPHCTQRSCWTGGGCVAWRIGMAEMTRCRVTGASLPSAESQGRWTSVNFSFSPVPRSLGTHGESHPGGCSQPSKPLVEAVNAVGWVAAFSCRPLPLRPPAWALVRGYGGFQSILVRFGPDLDPWLPRAAPPRRLGCCW
jgi:hypothetical protein